MVFDKIAFQGIQSNRRWIHRTSVRNLLLSISAISFTRVSLYFADGQQYFDKRCAEAYELASSSSYVMMTFGIAEML